MGKAYFDAREFTRAAHVLSSCSSARGQFLTIYSRFLVRSVFIHTFQKITSKR